MNYLAEIRAFYHWMETNEVSPSGIVLWHGLMFISNRSGWRPELSIPVSKIELLTRLSRTSIYRSRRELRDNGLIDFDPQDGRKSSRYKIYSLENRFVCQIDTQDGTQTPELSPVVCQIGTQPGTQKGENTDLCTNMAHNPAPYINNKDISKKKNNKKEKIDITVITDDPVWSAILSQWLDYRREIEKPYKGPMSVRKFLTELKNLSGGDPATAQKIIDKSISYGWQGIHALKDTAGTASHADQPATGQRIGQIKQPDDQRRQELLKKFNQKI